jgi:rSAM/selenodomain-associated transferase 1
MAHARTDCAIAVFARAPVAGEAKTRLIPLLGAEGAASLHARLVERMLTVALEANVGPVTLWCAPSRDHAFFARCVEKFGVALADQAPGDLGARMHAVFQARSPTLLAGTDCPSISATHLCDCASALRDGADAVFLPAEDGGYGLVGLARPRVEIFADMVWSTATVMEETRDRMRSLGLAWREPATIWDVDIPDDARRLAASGLLPDWKPSFA